MTFKDYFDINELFSPNMFYIGEIALGHMETEKDTLLLNAKVKNKKNMYFEFLEKYYYGPMKLIVNSNSLAYTLPPIISLCDREEGKRRTTFSFNHYVMGKIISAINSKKYIDEFRELGERPSLEVLNQFLKNALREIRKMYNDVLQNGKQSMYYSEVFKLYNDYMSYTKDTLKFTEFLNGLISGCTKSIVGTRDYIDFFSKEIKTDELVECFDYDRFCLVAAHSVMEGCMEVEASSNVVHNSVIYVAKYLEAIEGYRKINPRYQCSIVVIDEETGKRKNVTIDDIIEQYRSLLARHPEFKRFHIRQDRVLELLKMYGYDDEFIANFDFKSKDAEIVISILQKIEDNKTLLASWDIIPKGKRENQEVEVVPIDPRQPLEEQEKIRRMLIGREYLEGSGYLFYLEGINQFEGYLGYLYPNGIVIFEKYYENVETKKVASGNATYVMNLDNFVEVSKLTKTEIISKINSGEIKGVRRIFHREDMDRWKAAVSQAITGSDYTDQVVNYIDTLVSERVVEKKGVKQ